MNSGANGIVFWRALRDLRNGILGWGLVCASFAFLIGAIHPTISALVDQLLENPLFQMFVGDRESFTSAVGFVGAKFFDGTMPLFLGAYMVMLGLGIVAGEEERGTLDVLLSTPVRRWQVIIEKYLALVVAVIGVLALIYGGFLAARAVVPGFALTAGQLAGAVANLAPVMLLNAAVALFISTLTRSRSLAAGIAAAIIIGSYLIAMLSNLGTEALATIRYLSMYNYYHGTDVLQSGLNWGNVLLLSVVTVILVGLSLVTFQRRDLTV